jgi:hypothetical protein
VCRLRATALGATVLSLLTLSACAEGGVIGDGAEPGVVSGQVTYSDGRPLPDTTVAAISVEYETEISATSGEDGTYTIPIEQRDANYRAVAWIDVARDDQTYRFPLEPVGDPETHFHGEEGLAKDFIWKLTGQASWGTHLQPGDPRSFIGGSIALYDYDPNTDPASDRRVGLAVGSVIEITFFPSTPLIDGTEMGSFTREVTIDAPSGRFSPVATVVDVPLASYEVAARVRSPDGEVTDLLLSARCVKTGCPARPPALDAMADLEFLPADSSVHSRPYQSQPVAGIEIYFQSA